MSKCERQTSEDRYKDLIMECEESAQFEDKTCLNLILCRELIGLVKANECLWKKRCISHKDQQMKSLCWTSIGNVLTTVLSGPDAEKEFYKLRRKFGREVRKEKESAPRSGTGAGQPMYVSNWPLYKDLEFLKDVIKSRRRQVHHLLHLQHQQHYRTLHFLAPPYKIRIWKTVFYLQNLRWKMFH
ncbi:uncharacterized protein [Temnothorax longispinosus]|uniref:uncharacterized protein n=1 Tax=Temnothorax longispinosus TaxID=300112 RepID=UPI003A98E53C